MRLDVGSSIFGDDDEGGGANVVYRDGCGSAGGAAADDGDDETEADALPFVISTSEWCVLSRPCSP